MPETYNGYMGKFPSANAANLAVCASCKTTTDRRGMMEMFKLAGGPTDLFCLPCYYSRAPKREAAVYSPPEPVHPLACLAATAHKTAAEAIARADLVAYTLGHRPEIFPREPGAETYFVVGDSPLVKGFKAAVNPHA